MTSCFFLIMGHDFAQIYLFTVKSDKIQFSIIKWHIIG